MVIPTIPKSMANQSVTLKLNTDEIDDWGKHVTTTTEISNCIVQLQTIYAGDNNNRKITANAIVFFYAQITDPMPKLNRDSVGSKLIFEGKEYAITNIVDNRNPFGNDVWSYEIEVL